MREVQSIRCDATTGYFKFGFRGAVTSEIYANTTALGLVALLQGMPTVGKVTVTYDAGMSVLCTTHNDYYAHVTFIAQLGKVPLLTVEENALVGRPAEVTVTRTQTGSTQTLFECAGKGDCDRTTGMCRCWEHQGTSDGLGSPGDSGDCGSYVV
jgi:hypothetical protein